MNSFIIGSIIFLVAACIFAGIILSVRNKIRRFSKEMLGTANLIEGLKDIDVTNSNTPKSLNAMTSLYLPKIKKDFPEFQYDETVTRANNVLTEYLLGIDSMNPGSLSEGSFELKEKLNNAITVLRGEGCREQYRSIKIHRTEISNYRKADGRCIITFQMAIQYYYTKTDENGTLLAGNNDMLTQDRREVDLIYIQDRDKIANEHDYALGTNCPNCGAPLEGLGAKICQYCGTPLREINIYAWAFSDVR